MKESLSQQHIDALVDYRIQRAHETIAEIPYLMERTYYNTASCTRRNFRGSTIAAIPFYLNAGTVMITTTLPIARRKR